MDAHNELRSIPLTTVFAWLGFTDWKTRKSGSEHWGRCPHPKHNPKRNTGSFSFTNDGKLHCFGCDWKGKGAIDATMEMLGVGFQEACNWLKERSASAPTPSQPPALKEGSTATPDASSEVLKPFAGKYHLHQIELPWLTARCPDKAVRERYGIFAYSNPARKSKYQNKVFIPLKDLEGTNYGYLVRTPEPKEGEAKYEFPAGFPKSSFIFGAFELLQSLSPEQQRTERPTLKFVFLVESPFAVLKFASLGLPAVSPFGWSVSPEQVAILESLARGIVYIPDRNKSQESERMLAPLCRRLWVRFPPLPEQIQDPEQLSYEAILGLTR